MRFGLAVEALGRNWVGHFKIFLFCRDDCWPRAATIAHSLDSGCGLSHECAQNGCNGTRTEVRGFKAHLKPT